MLTVVVVVAALAYLGWVTRRATPRLLQVRYSFA